MGPFKIAVKKEDILCKLNQKLNTKSVVLTYFGGLEDDIDSKLKSEEEAVCCLYILARSKYIKCVSHL